MSWFRQNRFLGGFVVSLVIGTFAAAAFLWFAKSGFDEEKSRFDETAAELNRLQALTPFPTTENVATMKSQAGEYAAELTATKEELKAHVLPMTPLAPNEFQARLRQAMAAVGERARANHVKLPDNFYLGFEEFAAALPDTAAAPLLGQQLAQVELLLNVLIEARVDAISSFKRVPLSDPRAGASPTPTVAPAASLRTPSKTPALPVIERTAIEATFVSNPAAARRAINQVATANEQFYIIRTLHVLSEKDKGPPRDAVVAAGVSPGTQAVAAGVSPATSGNTTGTAATTGAAAGAPTGSALNFIVGNERIQTSARVEMLRFNF